jgi:formyl-CoA transferase/CoA:oxalate CoA-transferase
MLVEVDHPAAGRITVLNNPIRFSETPAAVRTPPPRLGEHTAEVLAAPGAPSS